MGFLTYHFQFLLPTADPSTNFPCPVSLARLCLLCPVLFPFLLQPSLSSAPAPAPTSAHVQQLSRQQPRRPLSRTNDTRNRPPRIVAAGGNAGESPAEPGSQQCQPVVTTRHARLHGSRDDSRDEDEDDEDDDGHGNPTHDSRSRDDGEDDHDRPLAEGCPNRRLNTRLPLPCPDRRPPLVKRRSRYHGKQPGKAG